MNSLFLYSIKRRQTGFTLIELMIAVVVIGILAAIAYPSYQEHINKSRRADAQAALMELAQFMERHYTNAGGYQVNGSTGGAPTLPFTKAPKDGSNEFYALSFSGTVTAQAYVLQAEPKNSMAGDKCGTMKLAHTGKKEATLAECWRR